MADSIHIKLPDGSVKELPKGGTAFDVAKSIGQRLADAALVAKTNGDLIDLTRPLEKDTDLRILTDKNRVVVEGINRVWKHVRPTQRTPQGGRIQKDAPIHISNVQPLDPTTGKGTRVRFESRDGKKHRIAIGSKTDLGVVGR